VAAAFVKLREGVHLLGGDIVEPEPATGAGS
jgi:hypothetical protein